MEFLTEKVKEEGRCPPKPVVVGGESMPGCRRANGRGSRSLARSLGLLFQRRAYGDREPCH